MDPYVDPVEGFLRRQNLRAPPRRADRILVMRKSMVIDDWQLSPSPLDEAGVREMAEAIRDACAQEAAAVNGRVNMRIVAMQGVNALASIGYVLTAANTADMPDDDLEMENGDQSVSASIAKMFAANQRHVERMVQLASFSLQQSAEAQRYAMHHLRSEVEALRAQEGQVTEQRIELAKVVAAKIIGDAENEAAAIKASEDNGLQGAIVKLLGGGLVSKLTGNPAAGIGALLESLSDEQKGKIMSVLSPEQQAALYMAMPTSEETKN